MRVKLEFPNKKPIFTLQIPVRISDINYGNHLGNDSVLSILHEARMQGLATLGFTELVVGGHGLIMADMMIAYKNEAFYGDVLIICMYAVEITEKTFDLLYRVTVERVGMVKEVAHAKTAMVCYDYGSRKVVPCNEKLKTWLQGD